LMCCWPFFSLGAALNLMRDTFHFPTVTLCYHLPTFCVLSHSIAPAHTAV
jgi:hypothetical protein